MLEPTEEMKEYIKVDQDLKLLESKKKPLRSVVLSQLLDADDDYKGLVLSEVKKTKLNEDVLISWLKENYPGVANEVIIKKEVIDFEAFDNLTAKGSIDYTDLPEDSYTVSTEYRINITRSKR